MTNDDKIRQAMTIEDAIKHCMDTALSNAGNAIAYLKGGQKMLAESCEKCAAEHEQLAKWLEELKQRRDAERWIPCSERMPENGQKCIVCMADKSIRFGVWCGDFDSWGVWEINKKLYHTITVPYWMPLPEQPKGGKQE